MKGKVILISIIFQILTIGQNAHAGNDGKAVIYEYIENHKDIAISEMHRTGIPASIKLAQAVLESDAGRSYLATTANNHFGIKCGSRWTGGKAYRKDDDYDRKGNLRHSCFRAYSDAKASFIAHSEFLADPRKEGRYGFLFNLDEKDYKAWAHGLKKAGYATNPKYPQLLINVIRSYELYKYDEVEFEPEEIVPYVEDLIAAETTIEAPEEKETKQTFFLFVDLQSYYVGQKNKVEYVEADEGDSPEIIAMEMGVPVDLLLEYNDHIYKKNEWLDEGDIVFIEQKRSVFKGNPTEYQVEGIESMEDISQKHGVKLKKLYKRNRMKEGTQPAQGERIFLRGKRPKNSSVRLRSPFPPVKEKNASNDSDQEVPPPSSIETDQAVISRKKEQATIQEVKLQSEEPVFHSVVKGETLFSISRKYQTTVDELVKLNQLKDHTIHPGQKLKVK